MIVRSSLMVEASDGRETALVRESWDMSMASGQLRGRARSDGRIVAKSGRRFLWAGFSGLWAFFGQSSFLVFYDASVIGRRADSSAREVFVEKPYCLGFDDFVLVADIGAGTLVRCPYPPPT